MKLAIVFLAFTGTAFWLYVTGMYVRLGVRWTARKVRQARGLVVAETEAQTVSAAAQTAAAASLDRATADLAEQRLKFAEAQEAATRLAIAAEQAAETVTR